ncbi:hypothetical protein ACFVH6_30025 [Spirillospora sp. NPDC127200]
MTGPRSRPKDRYVMTAHALAAGGGGPRPPAPASAVGRISGVPHPDEH